jgi:hypothetical protein
MLANFARMTACEVSGFPKTIRCDAHLAGENKQPNIVLHTFSGLISLLETLFNNQTLCSDRAAHDHPALVVEVAQDDLHAFSDLSEGV